jgi:hypothetical protein
LQQQKALYEFYSLLLRFKFKTLLPVTRIFRSSTTTKCVRGNTQINTINPLLFAINKKLVKKIFKMCDYRHTITARYPPSPPLAVCRTPDPEAICHILGLEARASTLTGTCPVMDKKNKI